MNFKQTILVLHFLNQLKKQSTREQLEPITKAFLYVLTREQLLGIIENMTGKGGHPDDPNFSVMSDEDLLKWIADQYYILDWLIETMEESIRL
jgi:hypothetical protein